MKTTLRYPHHVCEGDSKGIGLNLNANNYISNIIIECLSNYEGKRMSILSKMSIIMNICLCYVNCSCTH